MALFTHTVRLGKRDRFWLGVILVVIAMLFILRLLSHDGFSDSGRMVWKSAVLGSNPLSDTVKSEVHHSTMVRHRP
jgi:hypothetical protein